MTDYGELLVSGSTPQDVARSVTAVFRLLPQEMAQRLRTIRRNYFLWYGYEESLERLNNRTISQIFSEYQPLDVKPIAAGEIDGLRYELHEAPPGETSEGEEQSGE
jgi:hypothetical protein